MAKAEKHIPSEREQAFLGRCQRNLPELVSWGNIAK